MARSDYTAPLFTDVANPANPPAGAVALDAAHVNAMAQGIAASMSAADAATPGSATNAAIRGGAFNVRDYGAKGDGSTDDTAAFQSAANAAIAAGGRLVIQPPASASGYYKLSSTITLQPQGAATQFRLDIEGNGIPGTVRWAGAANGTVFKGIGWKRSAVSGVHVDTSTVAGVISWDIDTTVAFGSTSLVTFTNCFVNLGAQSGVGWRLGHVSGGGADISFITWVNCCVNGNSGGTPTAGSVGWLNEGTNALNNSWFGGFGDFLDRMVSNSGATTGNDSMYFYGLGGSHNNLDFEFAAPGSYLISGGRFEVGKRFLSVTDASNHAAITATGVNLSAYAPTDGILVYLGRPGTLVWDGNYVRSGGANYTAAAFTFDGFTGIGSFFMRGGAIQAVDPFYTFANPTQPWIQGVGLLNSSTQTVTRAANRLGS